MGLYWSAKFPVRGRASLHKGDARLSNQIKSDKLIE
jgi:hypothetical protein